MTSLSVRDTPCGRPSRHGTPPDIEANCTRAYVRAVMRKGKNPGTIRSPNTVSRVNQGKACDAVIRRIETREGHQRRDLAFPEREHHPAPIEVTCKIGERVYAFEHTRIEPFERQIELEAKVKAHLKPIRDRLAGLLPASEHFELWMPARAMLDLRGRELQRVQDAIVDWAATAASKAPTLPIRSRGWEGRTIPYTKLPNVPFSVFLAKASRRRMAGGLTIRHLVDGNVEEDRAARIGRAYNEKTKKLAVWQKLGAQSVLIFEENDIYLTNHELVADAVAQIDETAKERPDEIYLVSSIIEKSWNLWALRVDDHVYHDLSAWGTSLSEIDPTTLIDVTGE